MSEQNMALLSQNEIDTLISFLTNEKGKGSVGSEVLSQNSIDKLINLIKSNSDAPHRLQFHLPISMSDDEKIISFFSRSDNTYTDTAVYELLFEVKDGKACLCGKNVESGAIVPIRPCDVSDEIEEDDTDWGACVMPNVFNLVAGYLHLQYSQDTMDAVVRQFAKVTYGDEDAKVSRIYMPNESSAFLNLMSV